MFTISMPKTFKVGDTADCRINGKPRRVIWRAEDTLVIEPDDARVILMRAIEEDLMRFACSDAGQRASAYKTEMFPDGSVVVSEKR